MTTHTHNVENMHKDIILFSPQAEKAFVDIGGIVVGGYQSVELPLVNHSPCSVSFRLSVTQTVVDEDLAIGPKTLPNGTFCGCFLNDYTCAIRNYFV